MNSLCRWMTLVIATFLVSCLTLPAQDKPVAPVTESEEVKHSREELQFCLDHVAPMKLQFAKTGVEIERVANPVLRFGAPIFGNHHGTLWVWGQRGRPVAVLEMCQQMNDGLWHQACHTTTDLPIKLTMPDGQTWTPKSNNLKFQPLPGAPVPADTPTARLRQMKAFVQKFSAHQLWTWELGDGSRHELRMLPTPVHRYEDREQHLIDGALFIVAQGTNPEATLFLEAAQPDESAKPFWQFGVGQTSLAENVVFYEDHEIHHGRAANHAEAAVGTSSYWRSFAKVNDDKLTGGPVMSRFHRRFALALTLSLTCPSTRGALSTQVKEDIHDICGPDGLLIGPCS